MTRESQGQSEPLWWNHKRTIAELGISKATFYRLKRFGALPFAEVVPGFYRAVDVEEGKRRVGRSRAA